MADEFEIAGGILVASALVYALLVKPGAATVDGVITTPDAGPPGCALVRIDGDIVGLASPTGQFVLENVKPGTHTCRIDANDFIRQEQTFFAKDGQVTALTFVMQPLPTNIVPIEAIGV